MNCVKKEIISVKYSSGNTQVSFLDSLSFYIDMNIINGVITITYKVHQLGSIVCEIVAKALIIT